jgi:lipopolysaccharide export system protein LptC
MRNPILIGVLLFLLAGASWWLAETNEAPEEAIDFAGPRQVDYYLRDVNTTSMDTEGKRIRTLYSPKAKHFMGDDTTELEKPILTIYREQEPPWKIRSENGWVSPDGTVINLNGKVRITREADLGIRPVQLDTHNLRVQPEQDYAETDEEVRVRSYGDWLHGTGMRAWLRHPVKVKLLKDVTSFYEPPP